MSRKAQNERNEERRAGQVDDMNKKWGRGLAPDASAAEKESFGRAAGRLRQNVVIRETKAERRHGRSVDATIRAQDRAGAPGATAADQRAMRSARGHMKDTFDVMHKQSQRRR